MARWMDEGGWAGGEGFVWPVGCRIPKATKRRQTKQGQSGRSCRTESEEAADMDEQARSAKRRRVSGWFR